jgi:alkylation response protein AidB-like acyl-CoA dehydrogenase
MALPKDFGFGEDETMLQDTARRFFADNLQTEKLHKLVAENHEPEVASACHWQKEMWEQMVELGWAMIAVPENAGGIGMPAVAAVALAEEIGRVCLPSPMMQVMSATYVLAACAAERVQGAMDDIVGGKVIGLAITNKAGSWEHSETDITASEEAGLTLNGTAWYVQDARKLNTFVVKARSNAGIGLYLVPADAEGVSIHPDSIIDLSRDQAHVSFENVKISSFIVPCNR